MASDGRADRGAADATIIRKSRLVVRCLGLRGGGIAILIGSESDRPANGGPVGLGGIKMAV